MLLRQRSQQAAAGGCNHPLTQEWLAGSPQKAVPLSASWGKQAALPARQPESRSLCYCGPLALEHEEAGLCLELKAGQRLHRGAYRLQGGGWAVRGSCRGRPASVLRGV